MEILSVYGVSKKIVDAISILYKDTTAQVISPDGETDFFEIATGVLQGDTLTLHLFIVKLSRSHERYIERLYVGEKREFKKTCSVHH